MTTDHKQRARELLKVAESRPDKRGRSLVYRDDAMHAIEAALAQSAQQDGVQSQLAAEYTRGRCDGWEAAQQVECQASPDGKHHEHNEPGTSGWCEWCSERMAAQQAGAVPEGFVLVPRELTDAMAEAVWGAPRSIPRVGRHARRRPARAFRWVAVDG